MRQKAILFCILLLMTLAFVQPAVAQERSVFWEKWDVVIDNIDTTDNRFDVVEIYDLYFSGTFRFGQRVIADTNLEQITYISVYENGQPLQPSCSGSTGTFCVQFVQEGTSITYNFRNSVTNESRDFEIHYTVVGALRVYDGGDQLWWAAIPSDHYGFSIGKSKITVEMPQGYIPREDLDMVTTYGASADINVTDDGKVIAVATEQLNGNDHLEIRVQYPHDPNARIPAWQSSFDDRVDFEENVKPLIDITMIAVGLLLAIGGPLGAFALWYSRGRDPETGPVPQYLSSLPSDLPPAIVGTLVDEKADLCDVLSTIIDLGQRGYLVIEEERTEGSIFGIGAGSDFTFKRTDKSFKNSDLRKFEKRIMQKVFGSKKERTMDSLKNKFYKYIPKLQDDLYEELVKEGLFTSKPNNTRSLYNGVATAVLILAGVVGFVAFGQVAEFSGSLLFVPVAMGITGMSLAMVGSHMPAKTQKGAEEAAKWNAFREYLNNLERYDNPEAIMNRFEEYLPYAVAFGTDRTWVRRFGKIPSAPIPVWYYPTYVGGRYRGGYNPGTPLSQSIGRGLPSASDVTPGNLARAGGGGLDDMAGGLTGGLESISDGLTKMLNSASSTFTSRPSSSGSSGSWGGGSWSGGGGGGGGFSGGGSSGFG